MTRRDTIIITTLVNAGLLACLFVTATREEEPKSEYVAVAPQADWIEPKAPAYQSPKEEAIAYITDDVDLALKEFLPSDSGKESITEEEIIEVFKPEPTPPPKPQPKEESTTSKKTVEVKVKKGDFLEKIAKANGTTVSAIKAANNLKNDKLAIGQTLKIPVGDVKVPEKPKEAPPQDPSGEKPLYYTVESGDNPWKIAKKFHVRFEDILRLNNMTEEKSKSLKVGQEIRVK